MQLLGNTPAEKRQYKNELARARRDLGRNFDLNAFNIEYAARNGLVYDDISARDGSGDKMPADDTRGACMGSKRAHNTPAKDHARDNTARRNDTPAATLPYKENTPGPAPAMASYTPDMAPEDPRPDILPAPGDTAPENSHNAPEKITGVEYARNDPPGNYSEIIRQILPDINAAIATYKLDNDISGPFCKEKNGAIRFGACLIYVCNTVLRPSKILKAPADTHNAYNPEVLLSMIDICEILCRNEGLIFNRSLYMDFIGIHSDYLTDGPGRLTSGRVNLYERVLRREFEASLGAAYGSEIGNIRNLNENEARPPMESGPAPSMIAADALRALPGS